jgi:hypothetical protein
MKQFKFQNKGSVIRGIKEDKPKKRTNWDRVVYLAILILMLVSLIFYVVQRNIYVSSLGEVITERFDVMNAENIEILQFNVKQYDTVQKGDTLFKYRADFNDDNNGGGISLALTAGTTDKTPDWVMREKALTLKNIQLKKIELTDLEARIVKVEREIENLKVEVNLDVYSPAVLKQQRLLLADYKVEVQKTKSELSSLYQYLKQLNDMEFAGKQVNVAGTSIGTGNGDDQREKYYISPVSGIVTEILKPEHGIVYQKQVTMYISNLDKIMIKGYIEQNNIDYYKPGDIVQLRFMDGTKSKGLIKDFYINTQEVPEEFRQIRGLNQRNVVAEIVPVNDQEKAKWKQYYQFTVKVIKFKFFD